MKRMLYDQTRNYDEGVDLVIDKINQALTPEADDDFLLFCTGPKGTGKSSLCLHFYEAFDPEGCDVRYIGLNKSDHAAALKLAKEKKEKRFCGYDEASINKRGHGTKYNRDLINLMFEIRGLNIFHFWSYPSVDIIDKPFIEEIIKGLIYINDKSQDRPRLYYFFTKKALLEIWEKEKKLTHNILDKYKKKKAYYRGWFRPYKGKMWESYQELKKQKMFSAVEQFWKGMVEEQKRYTSSQAAEAMGYSFDYFKELFYHTKNKLQEGVDYFVTNGGLYRFTEHGIENISYYTKLRLKNRKRSNNFKNKQPWKKNSNNLSNNSKISRQEAS